MPASKVNYLVVYPQESQVYGTANKAIALSSPPPPDLKIEDKRIYFISVEPDTDRLVWRRIPDEEVQSAELTEVKEKKTKKEKED